METETRGRPFESLEWYRAAVRSSYHDERSATRVWSWLKGIEFLTVHISVFAIGIVALFVLNLLRSPENLWVDRAGAAWALLLTIHGVVIGLIWAIGLLGKEENEALQIIPDAEWRRTAASWPSAPNDGLAAGHAPIVVSGRSQVPPVPPPDSVPNRPPVREEPMDTVPSGWSAWRDGAQESASTDEPKVSWKEAASWLSRTGRGRAPAANETPPGDAPPSGGSSTQ